ncbi:MAG: hypothetical protein PWR26_743 [Methanosarcinales archaeon]|uniref:hypothetical protein n=1 Tax=Methermicoccus shengliensis TaxID=660064 RepID=UPI0005B2C5A0|nr:hypothetical protein [Methermicoccus shengliensis]MDI3488026.1 hypothetical protein [Methanosarcinales archaeon]MDN5295647.1 hypothetical protein [Methanosarcinales archaeon]
MEFEMLVGVVFAIFVIATSYIYDRVKSGGNSPRIKLSLPLLSSIRRKKTEEKMKEIDQKLEEVVSAGVSKGKENREEDKELDKMEELASKNVEVSDDLLNEMQTADRMSISEELSLEADGLPHVPDMPDLPSELNSDLEVDTSDVDIGFGIEVSEEEEGTESEKIEFDEEDDLIASIAKEVEVKEEEEIDLLRDLKGQNFDVNELENELNEALRRLKSLS